MMSLLSNNFHHQNQPKHIKYIRLSFEKEERYEVLMMMMMIVGSLVYVRVDVFFTNDFFFFLVPLFVCYIDMLMGRF